MDRRNRWLAWRDFEKGIKLMLIMIIRPTKEDVESLHDFFRLVITDTYRKEGIAEKKDRKSVV